MSSPTTSPFLGSTATVGPRLLSTDLGTIIPAFTFVALRIYTKIFLTHNYGWEDTASLSALTLAIGRTALDFVAVRNYQLGRHTVDVPPSLLQGEMLTEAIDGYFYMLAITLAKLSLLVFLYRIFSIDRGFRYTSWIVGVLISVWAIISVGLAMFSCRPVAAAWDLKLRMDPDTVCKPENYDVINVFGFCNILADFALLVMPMPMLWGLQMKLAKKLGVAVVFASGAL